MHNNEEKCPFCLVERDEKAEATLTLSRTYVTCGYCGGSAEPSYWHPEYALRAMKAFEVVQ